MAEDERKTAALAGVPEAGEDGQGEPDRAGADADQVRLARMLRALGNPVRLGIVRLLQRRQECICGEIVETTPLAQSTVSQHLKVLREAGLVRGTVEGPAVCYCLDREGLRWLKERVQEL